MAGSTDSAPFLDSTHPIFSAFHLFLHPYLDLPGLVGILTATSAPALHCCESFHSAFGMLHVGGTRNS